MPKEPPKKTHTDEEIIKKVATLLIPPTASPEPTDTEPAEKTLTEIISIVKAKIGAPQLDKPEALKAFLAAVHQVAHETHISAKKIGVLFDVKISHSEKIAELTEQLNHLIESSQEHIYFVLVAEQAEEFSLKKHREYNNLTDAPEYLVEANHLSSSGDHTYFVYKERPSTGAYEWGPTSADDFTPSGIVQIDEIAEKMYFIPIQGRKLTTPKLDLSGTENHGYDILMKNMK